MTEAWRLSYIYPGYGSGLRSPFMSSFVWPPGEKVTASCKRGHAAPDANCKCGIAAIPDLEDYLFFLGSMTEWENKKPVEHHYHLTRPMIISSRLEVSGAIFEGPRAWRRDVLGVSEIRAEHATLQELFVPIYYINDNRKCGFSEMPGTATTADVAHRLSVRYGVPVQMGLPRINPSKENAND